MKAIYVAGASKEIDYIESCLRGLREAGYHVTHDWCAEIRRAALAGYDANPADAPLASMRDWASADLGGVRRADMVWLLVPSNASAGAWVELGAAIALGVSVIVSGGWQRSIFAALADRRFATHEAALDWLRAGRST